jgi:hypothetical protein
MIRTALLVFLCASCTTTLRTFDARAPIVWADDDHREFGPRPAARRSTPMWDAADGLLFRSAARAFAVSASTESVDVNAFDEVPSSSWFTNRIGRTPMSPELVAQGACDVGADTEIAPRPWTIVGAKEDGMQPGLFIEDANGVRYLLKTDGPIQPERSSGAEAIVAALLYAAGYFVPCNRVVWFSPGDLVPNEEADALAVQTVIDAAARAPDGRVRASLSRFLPGTPLGAWSFEGRWSADPNDRVPHELRRELRAYRYFSAWVDHVDARAHNTLALWIGDRTGHVRHALLDFGDCLGAISTDERATARYGQAQWIEPGMMFEDLVSFGTLRRPWYRTTRPLDPVVGDFATEPFHPDRWRPNHANAAFEQARADDGAWAARILARFDEPVLRAVARLGRFSDRRTERAVARGLIDRRRVLLERYLTRLSPLSWPAIEGRSLCAEDLAISGGLRDERTTSARLYTWPREGAARPLDTHREGARVCAELPRELAEYSIVDLVTETAGRDHPGPLRVHIASEHGRARVIGIERPEPRRAP